MWFNSWSEILRVLIIGSAAYAAVAVVLPASGKRTLGQLNGFDFILTVAIGSTLATILLSSDVGVVLETNGSISVIPTSKLGNSSA